LKTALERDGAFEAYVFNLEARGSDDSTGIGADALQERVPASTIFDSHRVD
jgi:hypothetical protein